MSFWEQKICSAEEAASFISDGDIVGVSGFTLSGYPKVVPAALAKRAEAFHAEGLPFQISLYSGASTGELCDGVLAKANAISFRAPYQSNPSLREKINRGQIHYIDFSLGVMGRLLREGVIVPPDVCIIEVSEITEDGRIYLSTSGGNSRVFLESASKIILELNTRYTGKFRGLHDVYLPELSPNANPIPMRQVSDRAAEDFLKIPEHKLVAVVLSSAFDEIKPFVPPDNTSETIASLILEFLKTETKKGRLKEGFAFQSGVGNVANAVLTSMAKDPHLNKVNLFTEVIQEACISLLENDKLQMASGTSLMLSAEMQERFLSNLDIWKRHFILRQQEVSNSVELILRLGVISMNTALECDIFGNVNSSHVLGSAIMNGIGGSADFARHARLGFFMTPSTAKNGTISSIVPLVSHVDHTDHDTMFFVTEQGIADLRGLSAEQKAIAIIENCAHPDFRSELKSILNYGKSKAKGMHIPLALSKAFSFHERLEKENTMKL